MKNRLNTVILLFLSAVIALPAMAQWNTRDEQTVGAGAPSASFQSTSTMQSSGSAYSTSPMLNADGTATYNAATAPSQAPGGPRKVGPPTPGGNPTPVGDGMWALMVLAAAYGAYIVRNRVRAKRMRKDA